MARTRSLTNLIADVRSRTNLEDSEFVSDDEITEYLNQELAELHGRLVQCEGQPHFRKQTTVSVVSGTALYALPADFWRVQRITASLDGYNVDLESFMEGERASLSKATIYGYVARGQSPLYRVQGDMLEFRPATRSYTATLFYIRNSPRLVAGSDVVDGFNGYELAAIYGACATVQSKEETDPAFYLAQKDRIFRHIDAMAAHRDGSHPERVTDVTGALDMSTMPWLWR